MTTSLSEKSRASWFNQITPQAQLENDWPHLTLSHYNFIRIIHCGYTYHTRTRTWPPPPPPRAFLCALCEKTCLLREMVVWLKLSIRHHPVNQRGVSRVGLNKRDHLLNDWVLSSDSDPPLFGVYLNKLSLCFPIVSTFQFCLRRDKIGGATILIRFSPYLHVLKKQAPAYEESKSQGPLATNIHSYTNLRMSALWELSWGRRMLTQSSANTPNETSRTPGLWGHNLPMLLPQAPNQNNPSSSHSLSTGHRPACAS